jgi:hypothetical protein
MKKAVVFALALFLFAPSLIFSNTLSIKVGLFFPTFKSDLWDTEFENMNFRKHDYYNANFGLAFDYFVNRQLSVMLSIDFYSKDKLGYYKRYVGYYADTLGTAEDYAFPDTYRGNYTPSHTFNVSITPIQLSLKLMPLGRARKLIPYVGGGVGLYVWSVRLYGYLIDFSDEAAYTDPNTGEVVSIYGISSADIQDETRLSVGYHAFGGIMFPIANRTTVELEFKYNIVRGNLENFSGFQRFDLGAFQLSLGINFWL